MGFGCEVSVEVFGFGVRFFFFFSQLEYPAFFFFFS